METLTVVGLVTDLLCKELYSEKLWKGEKFGWGMQTGYRKSCCC